MQGRVFRALRAGFRTSRYKQACFAAGIGIGIWLTPRLLPGLWDRMGTSAADQNRAFSDEKSQDVIFKVSRFSQGYSVKAFSATGPQTEMRWADVLEHWQQDSAVCSRFSEVLAGLEFHDFFWECSPVSGQQAAKVPFECVVLDAHGSLASTPASSDDFDEHLNNPKHPGSATVIQFANLGGDAMLVVPRDAMAPAGAQRSVVYGHLAAFVRNAPEAQRAELWRVVAENMQSLLQQDPTSPRWLNTEGSGVPWVHARLDSRPKYYHHTAFKRFVPTSDT